MSGLHGWFLFGGGSKWLHELRSRVLSSLIGLELMYSMHGWVILLVDGAIRCFRSMCRRYVLFSGRQRLFQLRHWDIPGSDGIDFLRSLLCRFLPRIHWGEFLLSLPELRIRKVLGRSLFYLLNLSSGFLFNFGSKRMLELSRGNLLGHNWLELLHQLRCWNYTVKHREKFMLVMRRRHLPIKHRDVRMFELRRGKLRCDWCKYMHFLCQRYFCISTRVDSLS